MYYNNLPTAKRLGGWFAKAKERGEEEFVIVYEHEYGKVYYKASTPEQAIEAGAKIVFDFWGDEFLPYFPEEEPYKLPMSFEDYEAIPEGAKEFVLEQIIQRYDLRSKHELRDKMKRFEIEAKDAFEYLEASHAKFMKSYQHDLKIWEMGKKAVKEEDKLGAYLLLVHADHNKKVVIEHLQYISCMD